MVSTAAQKQYKEGKVLDWEEIWKKYFDKNANTLKKIVKQKNDLTFI